MTSSPASPAVAILLPAWEADPVASELAVGGFDPVVLDGVHELAAGDSLYFDAATPHRLVNPGSKDAQVLCVFHGRGRPLMAKPRKRCRPATT